MDKEENLKRTKEITKDEKINLFKKACYDSSNSSDAFIRAANDKDNATIVKMLQHHPEIERIIKHGTDKEINKLELVEACANGQIETVRALVDAKADINAGFLRK